MPLDPLDATLPTNLQNVVTFDEPKTEKGGSTMPVENAVAGLSAIQTVTPEQVRAIASELVAAKDAEKAVAAKIQSLTDEGAKHKRDLEAAIAEGLARTTEVKVGNDRVKALETELATANAKVAELEKTSKAQATALKKIETEKAVATRVAALTEAGVAGEDRVKIYTAVAEDGSFKLSDEAFNAIVTDLAEAKKKNPFDKKDDKDGKDKKDKKDGDTDDKNKANATQEQPAQATAEAKKDAVPAAPDLSTIDGQAQALAALAAGSGTTATPNGRANYAKHFGAGL